MFDRLLEPWPWWISGTLIGLTVPVLFVTSGKAFSISTSLQQVGAMRAPRSDADYLRTYDRRRGLWTLFFVVGIAIGGYIGTHLLSAAPIEFLPASYRSVGGAIRLAIGGFLIGFGARYAGGCTSGHAITGISNLNWPSVVATTSFFAGGLAVTWVLGSLIFE